MGFQRKKIIIGLSAGMVLVLVIVAFILSDIQEKKVNDCIEKQTEIVNIRRKCEEQGRVLAEASDFLTTEVWHFVATQEVGYLKNYWNEVENIRTRDKAIQRLSEFSLTQQEQNIIGEAKQESDELIEQEAWAMKLVVEGAGINFDEVPELVKEVMLSPEEENLTPDGKLKLANQYIFSEQYTTSKGIIKKKIEEFRSLLSERINKELADAIEQSQAALHTTQLYNIGLMNIGILLLLLFTIIMFYQLVIYPFRQYTVSLSHLNQGDFLPLKPSGSKETKMFAEVFNQIYNNWKQQKEDFEKERFRFRVAVKNTSVIVFEYNCASDVYTAYGVLEHNGQKEENMPMEQTIPDFLAGHVEELVEAEYSNTLKELLSGRCKSEKELRVRAYQESEKYIWCRGNVIPICGPDHRVVKIIGKFSNIESEKQKEFALEDVKSRDNLTKFYNKETGIRKIEEYMDQKDPQEICGMLLLDMDHFKKLNENEGVVFADAILQEAADVICSFTEPTDIKVRLGGDEFMLFIKNCSKTRANRLGSQIAQGIQNLSIGQDIDAQISASIGICTTEVVDEYSGLYRCAESTLKYIKEHEKGRAAYYLDTCNELGKMLVQVYTERHRINDIDQMENHQHENLVAFALELLGGAKNLDDAMFLLLTRIGRNYKADRVSILEINQEYLNYRFTYQWAKSQADLRMGRTFYLKKEELNAIINSYDQDGLCDQYILSHTHNTASCLHAAIYNNGSYTGGLWIELWEDGHVWTPDERKLLVEIEKVIASFLLKARADAVSAAKSEFLSRMSHEIRTPMNVITGMTAIAKDVLDDKKKILDCLNKIESANSYLLNLINDILDMSKIESGKIEINPESMNFAEEMWELEELMRPHAEEKGLEFLVNNEYCGNQRVMVDQLRLNQILINIIGNAVKYTPSGGRIVFSIQVQEETDQMVRLLFSVKDTGIGIAKDAVGRVFHMFEQEEKNTASTFGGTGLGLAISSQLVQMMGGELKVNSEVGKGSEFYFSLSISYGEEEEIPESQVEIEQNQELNADLCGKRILLAEDNEINREIAETILEMNGLMIESTSDGREAVEQFSRHEPYYYDVVLMDIRMPVMDGLEATKKIRTLGKRDSRAIPIIAMTANAFDEDMKKSLEIGMNGHLSKPIEVDKLLKMLHACMRG